MPCHTQTIEGIILKRKNLGETDRLLTIITQEHGKFECVAKGVRKLKSSTRAALEPGNIAKVYLVNTKGLPLLVQARLIDDASATKTGLVRIRQLTQILEIFDKLFVEEELPISTYNLVKAVRQDLISNQTQFVRHHLNQLLEELGFATSNYNPNQTMLEYVQQIAQQPMRSFEYLQIDNHKKIK
ncbi:MAG: DNA repair protein RecO [Microgenomates bacterium 39_7]|nr:MAG: DNA repair protein RecO [Microgenomates bacterium 39_7]